MFQERPSSKFVCLSVCEFVCKFAVLTSDIDSIRCVLLFADVSSYQNVMSLKISIIKILDELTKSRAEYFE